MTYDVFYRREGETSWKVLQRAVIDPIIVWDDICPERQLSPPRRRIRCRLELTLLR